MPVTPNFKDYCVKAVTQIGKAERALGSINARPDASAEAHIRDQLALAKLYITRTMETLKLAEAELGAAKPEQVQDEDTATLLADQEAAADAERDADLAKAGGDSETS